MRTPAEGKRPSLRGAINAFCRMCIHDPFGGGGTGRPQVEACMTAVQMARGGGLALPMRPSVRIVRTGSFALGARPARPRVAVGLRRLMRGCFVGAVLFFLLPSAANPTQTTAPLFTGCRMVTLRVEAPSYAEEDVIRSMAESRLRSAAIYRNPIRGRNYLAGATLWVELRGQKLVVSFSSYGGRSGRRPTTSWSDFVFDREDSREVLAAILDHFVQEYLRVNESACLSADSRAPRP